MSRFLILAGLILVVAFAPIPRSETIYDWQDHVSSGTQWFSDQGWEDFKKEMNSTLGKDAWGFQWVMSRPNQSESGKITRSINVFWYIHSKRDVVKWRSILFPSVAWGGEYEDCLKESRSYHAQQNHDALLCIIKSMHCRDLKFREMKQELSKPERWKVKQVSLPEVNKFLKENPNWEPFGTVQIKEFVEKQRWVGKDAWTSTGMEELVPYILLRRRVSQ